MTNQPELPTMYQEVGYVYAHVDPNTLETLYVGRGSGFRAWAFKAYHRDLEHTRYLEHLVSEGYLPSDWVRIIDRNLSIEASKELEREQIILLSPRFNKIAGLSLVKLKGAALELAHTMRLEGSSYYNISKILNVSTMTVYRALNNQTISMEKFLAR